MSGKMVGVGSCEGRVVVRRYADVERIDCNASELNLNQVSHAL